jgi:hypothetical protein
MLPTLKRAKLADSLTPVLQKLANDGDQDVRYFAGKAMRALTTATAA